MIQLPFHPEAEIELADAIQYYTAEAGPEVATEFLDKISSAVEAIANHPYRCSYWSKTEARRFVIRRYPYALFYVVVPAGTRVLAVAHTSRRPGYWKSRLVT